MACVEADMLTHLSSFVRYTLRGAAVVERLPVRTFAQFAAGLVARGLRAHEGKQRFQQRQIDHLPHAAADFDMAQRDHHRKRAVGACGAIGKLIRRQYRFAVGKAIERGKARHAFGQRAEAGLVFIRPGLPPAGNPHDYQLGIARVQHLGAEAHFFEGAGAEVFILASIAAHAAHRAPALTCRW
jgi:hypothetical protein